MPFDTEPRTRCRADASIHAVEVAAYTIPTDAPESDGTLEWHATTIVVVAVRAAGASGLGYSSTAAAELVRGALAPAIAGGDAMDVTACDAAMWRCVRNVGRYGAAAAAV
jgi:hypothetical protein